MASKPTGGRRRPTAIIPSVIWPTELQARWNVGDVTLWRWTRDGKIPQRDFKLGARLGWKRSTIEAFEAAGGSLKQQA
jgi:predicted DNA-binding transcriptional regulator AlpA